MLPLEPYDRNGLAGGPTQNNHFQTNKPNKENNPTYKKKSKTIFTDILSNDGIVFWVIYRNILWKCLYRIQVIKKPKTRTKLNGAGRWNLHKWILKCCCQMDLENFWYFSCIFFSVFIVYFKLCSIYWNPIKDYMLQCQKGYSLPFQLTNNIFVTVAVHPPRQCLCSTNIVWSTFDALQNSRKKSLLSN